MSVVVNDAALGFLLRSTAGPVGIDTARRAFNVEEHARLNASGPVIDIRTDDLRSSIRTRVEQGPDGLLGIVSSAARHRGFLYPAIVARSGERPAGWLIDALAEGFR